MFLLNRLMLMEKVDLPQLWNIFNQVCRHLCAALTLWRLIIRDRSGMDVWDAFFFFFSSPSADYHLPPPASPPLLSAPAAETSWKPRLVRPLRTQRHGVGELQTRSGYRNAQTQASLLVLHNCSVSQHCSGWLMLMMAPVFFLLIECKTRYFDKNIKSVVGTFSLICQQYWLIVVFIF